MSSNPSLKLCGTTLPSLGWCLVSGFQLLAEDLLRAARYLKDDASEDKAKQALKLVLESRPPTKEELIEWRNEFKNTDNWSKDANEWRYMKEPEYKSLRELLEDLVVAPVDEAA
ncbi:hypothetical protein MRS44_018732 [Fusarium solani]|uniref:uncharacterized protein n=1 Tax=Fusarium solani TaxID=169388 RepID=UPI0032C43CF1|nr:hypothetical protein MRS44_018732 [Fusarium solani]